MGKKARAKKVRAKLSKCTLECPRCHGEWAELSWAFDREVKGKDVRVLEGDKKFKDGEILVCTICGHQYTNWDLLLAMAGSGGNKNNGKDKEVRLPGHRDQAKE